MIDHKNNEESLKLKFHRVERIMDPHLDPMEIIKRQVQTDIIPLNTKFLKTNADQIKNFKKILRQRQKQWLKHKTELKSLLDLKEDNQYKLEKMAKTIEDSQREVINLESTILQLQQEKIIDESRLDSLHAKRVELEGRNVDARKQKDAVTSDYHNLLNTIYLKETEMNNLEEKFCVLQSEIEKKEKEFLRETKNLKTLQEKYEKESFRFQKAKVEQSNLSGAQKEITQKLKNTQNDIEDIKQEIFKLNSSNERISNHVNELTIELKKVEERYLETNNNLEGLRVKNLKNTSRRDELVCQIRALKSEHSKNIIELEVREREKLTFEQDVRNLLQEKNEVANKIFAQKTSLKEIEKRIGEYTKEKKHLLDTIKLNQLHSSRYQADIARLEKEAENLKQQFQLLHVECESQKKEVSSSQERMIAVQGERNNWSEKKAMSSAQILEHKKKIQEDNEQINSYVKEIEDFKIQTQLNENDIQRFKKIHANMASQLDKARIEHDIIASDYRKFLNESHIWKERVISRENDINSVSQKISDIKEETFKTRHHTEQNKNFLVELDKKLSLVAKEHTSLNEELSVKKQTNLELEKKIKILVSNVKDFESQRENTLLEIESQSEYLEKKQLELSRKEELYENVKSAISAAKKEYEKINLQSMNIQNQINKKEKECNMLEGEFTNIYQEKSKVEEHLKKLNTKRSALINKKESTEKRILALKQNILNAKNKIKDFEREKQSLSRDMLVQQKQAHAFENEFHILQTTVDAKCLELLEMKNSIHEGISTTTSKKEEYQKLRDRNLRLESQINEMRNQNHVEEGHIKTFDAELRDLKAKNAQMAASYEEELKKRDNLKEKVSKIKWELQSLEQSYFGIRSSKEALLREKTSIDETYKILKEEKEKLLDNIELKMQLTEVKNDDPQTNSAVQNENKSQSNDFYTDLDSLRLGIGRNIQIQKNASVILSSISELVSAIEANEFYDLKWAVKTSSTSTHDGCKIRFTNMQSQYSEMKKILKPIVGKLTEKFRTHGINIETRSQTSPGDVLEAIEFKITIENFKRRSLEIS